MNVEIRRTFVPVGAKCRLCDGRMEYVSGGYSVTVIYADERLYSANRYLCGPCATAVREAKL